MGPHFTTFFVPFLGPVFDPFLTFPRGPKNLSGSSGDSIVAVGENNTFAHKVSKSLGENTTFANSGF